MTSQNSEGHLVDFSATFIKYAYMPKEFLTIMDKDNNPVCNGLLAINIEFQIFLPP